MQQTIKDKADDIKPFTCVMIGLVGNDYAVCFNGLNQGLKVLLLSEVIGLLKETYKLKSMPKLAKILGIDVDLLYAYQHNRKKPGVRSIVKMLRKLYVY